MTIFAPTPLETSKGKALTPGQQRYARPVKQLDMLQIELRKLSDLKPHPDNPRKAVKGGIEKLADSIKGNPEYFNARPIVVSDRTGVLTIIDGERRSEAAAYLGMAEVPTIVMSGLTYEQELEILIKGNTHTGVWDEIKLATEKWNANKLQGWGVDLPNWGGQNKRQKFDEKYSGTKLNDRFVVPPFSVLDTRQGYWKERKQYWNTIIGDNGESREGTLAASGYVASINNGVSILDPVMAEFIIKCFAMPNCKTFDCFAGDSVFGAVSSRLGNYFTGIEIRQEQVDLNQSRVDIEYAKYICDDGQNVAKHLEKESQDLLFSCPPYYDLEVYSELENDASNQETYEDFIKILENAFTAACTCLKNNRFAVIVVGDVRDKKSGFYYDFPGDIKRIFKNAGLGLYNECILVEPIGTLPIRANNGMKSRKVGKCHQNILIFYKGDTKKISKEYPSLSYNENDLKQ